MSVKQQLQSPLKKGQKSCNQGQLQEQYQGKKSQYSVPKSPFMTEGQKINFESQDSQGSDISYESSIEEEDDINIGHIDYFKEEMARFFINYPELINGGILDNGEEQSDCGLGQSRFGGKQQKLNNNWALVADQILNEAKDSSSFLQSLSHRIALYRSKVYQEDLIDVLLREEKNIMRQIQLEISLRKKETKGAKNTMMEHAEGCENVYFSWRKKKEVQNKINLHIDSNAKDSKTHLNREAFNLRPSPNNHPVKDPTKLRDRANTSGKDIYTRDASRSLNKKTSDVENAKASTFFLTSNDSLLKQTFLDKKNSNNFHLTESRIENNISKLYSSNPAINKRTVSSLGKNSRTLAENQRKKTTADEIEKQNRNLSTSGGQAQTFWKHLVNFEPRTEAGRQLCQLIRKTNSPNDELGIKKTIMQFLVKNKETVQNEVILKSTISKKIQKLYNDDSKELLMFYPTKMTVGEGNFGQGKSDSLQNQGSRQSGFMSGGLGDFVGQGLEGVKGSMYPGINGQNEPQLGNKLFNQGQKFMHLLQDIVEGPLMKYWMMLQENKL